MKSTFLLCGLVLLLATAVQLPAQQSDADHKLFEEIKTAAEKGDSKEQYELGRIYFNGKLGIEKDYRSAAGWYLKAAKQGHAQAQLMIGGCYAIGYGVVTDQRQAMKWTQKAADQNVPVAQCVLGASYHDGDGVAKDYEQAIKWYRKAAEQGLADAQFSLGNCYAKGEGVTKNEEEAVKWFFKAAEQGLPAAQVNLGRCLKLGEGVAQNDVEAAEWYRKAAEQEYAVAQCWLAVCYATGKGVIQDTAAAVKLWRSAAEQGDPDSQFRLGGLYNIGFGVPKNYIEAYKWMTLSLAQGNNAAQNFIPNLERLMTREQIAEGQKLARDFKPHKGAQSDSSIFGKYFSDSQLTASGTGFFITDDGYLISNYHVVKGAAKVRLLTGAGLIDATVVKVDAANDLALLKAVGRFASLPIAASRTVKLGGTVATVGFPATGMQGFSPKLAKGEIASLAGIQDDPRYFQISVPVQHGNSGGALVDVRGNVVGIVAARLGVEIGKAVTSDELPENVNYAVKSSLLLSFLESVPDVASKIKEPNTKDEPFEDVVKSAQDAAVLVLVY